VGHAFTRPLTTMKTFVHRFNSSLKCTVQVTDSAPPHGSQHVLNAEWTGRPKPKHLREYIRWMNEVNRQLADEWNIRMMQVFMVTPTQWEFWGYAPGEPPTMLKDPGLTSLK
jgi:hypothetical protein